MKPKADVALLRQAERLHAENPSMTVADYYTELVGLRPYMAGLCAIDRQLADVGGLGYLDKESLDA